MDITDLLQGPMKDIIIGQVTNQLGVNDKNSADTAMDGILATLLNGLKKNASTPEGQASLNNALERDHNGSIFDNLTGFLTGSNAPQNESTVNGAGILKHILGDQQEEAVNSISKASGLDTGKILKMMITMAPLVMGFLGKAKSQPNAQQSSGGSILDILSGATQAVNQKPAAQSILESILGGGNQASNNPLGGIAGSILGKIFGK